MNGNQSRFSRLAYRISIGDFRNYGIVGKIQEAKTRFKENGIEAVGWIGFLGFGISSIVRMMGG